MAFDPRWFRNRAVIRPEATADVLSVPASGEPSDTGWSDLGGAVVGCPVAVSMGAQSNRALQGRRPHLQQQGVGTLALVGHPDRPRQAVPTSAYPGGGSDLRSQQAAGCGARRLSREGRPRRTDRRRGPGPDRTVPWRVLGFAVRVTRGPSARQLADGADEVLVTRVQVDRGRHDRLVPREALGDADVLGPAVERRAGGETKRVEGEPALEARALLPEVDGATELARREPGVLGGSRTAAPPAPGARPPASSRHAKPRNSRVSGAYQPSR
jgi:hypothetical protein